MKIQAVLFMVAFSRSFLGAQDGLDLSLPDTVSERFQQARVWDKYAISGRVNPFYQRGDFDGDGRADYAVLLRDLATQGEAIGFIFSRERGVVFSERKGREFDGWLILSKGSKVENELVLKNEAIVLKFGGPGIVIAWNGRTFESYRWGD